MGYNNFLIIMLNIIYAILILFFNIFINNNSVGEILLYIFVILLLNIVFFYLLNAVVAGILPIHFILFNIFLFYPICRINYLIITNEF